MRCRVSPKLGLVLLLLLPLPLGCRDWDQTANPPKQIPLASPKDAPNSLNPLGSPNPDNNSDLGIDRNSKLPETYKLYRDKIAKYSTNVNEAYDATARKYFQELGDASRDWLSERKQLARKPRKLLQSCLGLRQISQGIDQRAQEIQEQVIDPAAAENFSDLQVFLASQSGKPEGQARPTKTWDKTTRTSTQIYLERSQIELTTLLQVEKTLSDQGCPDTTSALPEENKSSRQASGMIGWLVAIMLGILAFRLYQRDRQKLKELRQQQSNLKKLLKEYERTEFQNQELTRRSLPPQKNISYSETSELNKPSYPSNKFPNDVQVYRSNSSDNPNYSQDSLVNQRFAGREQYFSLEERFNQQDSELSRVGRKVRVDENSINRRWGGEKADILLEAGNGHYLIVNGDRLIPKPNFKLNSGNIKTLRAIFQWDDETVDNANVNDLEMYLEEAAYVSSYDSNHWKLEKQGVIRWNVR